MNIYSLKNHRDVLIEEGIIGKEKNTDKLLAEIEKSKENDPVRLLTGLAIRNVGNIKVANNIEILGSASIKGDIECATMVMDENAYFEGTCKMNRSENKDKEKKKA